MTYDTDRSSETRLSKFTRFWSPTVGSCQWPDGPVPRTPTSGPHSSRRNNGVVMRDLNETDEVPTKIVKVIGDMCGILLYTVIVGMVLYALLH
jgi:hypothetical protein